jgi:hypothetical protein
MHTGQVREFRRTCAGDDLVFLCDRQGQLCEPIPGILSAPVFSLRVVLIYFLFYFLCFVFVLYLLCTQRVGPIVV